MTWFANQIYTKPVRSVIDAFGKHPFFRDQLYHVTNLDGIRSIWTRAFMLNEQSPIEPAHLKHGLPDEGLLVVCPNTNQSRQGEFGGDSRCIELNDPPAAKWQALNYSSETNIIVPENRDKEFWPQHLLQFLKEVQTETAIPIVYYYCATWGGSIEEEAAWIFDEVDCVLSYVDESEIRKETADDRTMITGNILQLCMGSLDFHLPTGFFALHETSFDWAAYRIITEESNPISNR